ncbi:MAG: D-alanyl-D-alanine carboxypeptidase family protein [Bacillota bacterium]
MSRRPALGPTLRSILCALFVLQIAFAPILGTSVAFAAEAPPEAKADNILLGDFKSGRVLYEKDADLAHIPASLTKIMTMYVLFDEIAAGNVSMDDMVDVSELAWATEGSKMYILVGSKVKLEDLVKGITVMSGNDACVAVAEHVAGNVTSFVDRMNAKAKELGMNDTHFVDPHGLSDENRTSARDLLTLTRSYLALYPETLQFHSLKEFAYTAPGESKKDPQFNRNRLLWTYPGTYGLKTGFTTRAGFNMIALVERSGLHVVAIVLGSAKGMSIDDGEKVRSQIVTSLLDWAYRNYSYVGTHEPGVSLGKVRVWKGRGKVVDAVAPLGLGATVEKGMEDQVTSTVNLRTDLEAPIRAGSKVGEVIFSAAGQEIGRADLVAKNDVPKGNIFRVLWDSITRALSRAFTKK